PHRVLAATAARGIIPSDPPFLPLARGAQRLGLCPLEGPSWPRTAARLFPSAPRVRSLWRRSRGPPPTRRRRKVNRRRSEGPPMKRHLFALVLPVPPARVRRYRLAVAVLLPVLILTTMTPPHQLPAAPPANPPPALTRERASAFA